MNASLMSFKIVPIYAALLAFLYLALTAFVIIARKKERVLLGPGEDPKSPLFRAVRAHGNFAEYTPFLLILMAFLELQGADALLLHSLGFLFVFSRILHAVSIGGAQHSMKLRVRSMMATLFLFGVMALANLYFAIRALVAAKDALNG